MREIRSHQGACFRNPRVRVVCEQTHRPIPFLLLSMPRPLSANFPGLLPCRTVRFLPASASRGSLPWCIAKVHSRLLPRLRYGFGRLDVMGLHWAIYNREEMVRISTLFCLSFLFVGLSFDIYSDEQNAGVESVSFLCVHWRDEEGWTCSSLV